MENFAVAVKLVGMLAAADFVFNDDGEATGFIYNENINVMPLAENVGTAKVYAVKIKGRLQEIVQECRAEAMITAWVQKKREEIGMPEFMPHGSHGLKQVKALQEGFQAQEIRILLDVGERF